MTPDQLQRHLVTHEARTRELKCRFCTKTYFRRDVLKSHEKLHVSPTVCAKCGKGFAHDKNLLAHVKTAHDDDCGGAGMFVSETDRKEPGGFVEKVKKPGIACQHCHVGYFKNLYSLKRHLTKHKCPLLLETHQDQECSLCMADEATYTSLRRHVLVNNGKRVHGCAVCQKRFRTPQELANHGTTHTGMRPFECSVCLDKFSQLSSLNAHAQRHENSSGKNCFGCDVCDRVCKSQAAWRAHIKTHEEEMVAAAGATICDDGQQEEDATLIQIEIVDRSADTNTDSD